MKRKSCLTLIEIIIVIALISSIGAVVAFNMRKVLDRGKQFRTDRAIEQLHDLLMLESVEKGLSLQEVVSKRREIVSASGIGRDPDAILRDGWGSELHITLSDDGQDLVITSPHRP